MKKVVLSALLCACSTSFASQLTNFNQIAENINNGHGIRVKIDSGLCEANTEQVHSFIGTVEPTATILLKEKRLSFSDLHFTRNNPQYPGKAIYESNRFVLNSDNSFSLHSQLLDPSSFAPLGNETTIECALNAGVQFFSKP